MFSGRQGSFPDVGTICSALLMAVWGMHIRAITRVSVRLAWVIGSENRRATVVSHIALIAFVSNKC